jgi:hypothetical protein
MAAVVLGWGAALLRVHVQIFPGVVVWSFGRYTFVAMVPSMLMFVTGLRELLPPSLRGRGLAIITCFLCAFALAALFFLHSAYRFG